MTAGEHDERYVPAPLLLAVSGGALCGIVYELLLASLASYLVGDTVLVFSVTVGVFLASMGLGAYLSRFVADRLLGAFLAAEIALGVVGGIAPLGLFAVYVADGPYVIAHGVATMGIGMLVGLELPLITRMLERGAGLRLAIAKALALDYVGCLLGSVLFPLVLLPFVGMLRSALIVGAVGPALAFVVAWQHRHLLERPRLVLAISAAAAAAMLAAIVPSQWASDSLENELYEAPIVARTQSRYQRIVVTRSGPDVRLFLDGDLQFSSVDEYRYHEALVHPALALHPAPRRVLLLGAGDGLALREVLAHPGVTEAVLVELDPAMIDLAKGPALRKLNRDSFADPRVQVMIADAFVAMREGEAPLDRPFDVIIADFPDPDHEAIARLYSKTFYAWLAHRLAPDGLLVTQATSPFHTPRSFGCIGATLADAGFTARPYVVDVPSFGPWGFYLAGRGALPDPARVHLAVTTRYLTDALAHNLFDVPRDLEPPLGLDANDLLDPVLLGYHRDGRRRVN